MNSNDSEHPVRPSRGDVVVEAIPSELRGVPQWLCWRYEFNGNKWTKVPISSRTKRKASATNPDSYADFDTALSAFRRSPDLDGIGFAFTADDEYCGIDLDACIIDGQLSTGAAAIVAELSTYTEVSPSGRGLKCFLRARMPGGAKNRCNDVDDFDHLELYDSKRFFTVTGQLWDGTPTGVGVRQTELDVLCSRLWPPKRKAPLPEPKLNGASLGMSKREERCRKYIEKCPPAESGNGGHDATLRAACECFRFDLDEAAAWRVMERFNAERTCGEPWSRDELAHKIADARAKVEAAGERGIRLRRARPPAGGNAHRATILIPGAHVSNEEQYVEMSNLEFTAEVLRALPAGTLYRRASLVGQIAGVPGERQFAPLTVDGMRLVIDAHIRLASWGKDSETREPVEVFRTSSRDHGDLLIAAAANSPTVRELRMVLRYPSYLPDFERAVPGFNNTGVYFDEPDELAALEPLVDPEQIRAVLTDLVVDFPFRSNEDRANFIGALMTPMLLPAIAGNFPLHLVSAPLERTGKTKLASEVMGYIYAGHPLPTTQLVAREEEIEKRILAFLIQDSIFVLLDNIRTSVDSATVASLLTSRFFSGRLLGGSKMITLPNNLLLLGTGNNIATSAEMAKRSVLIYLQPQDAEPERRVEFRHPNLAEYVKGQRRRVFEALIGAVEFWKQRGRPRHPKRKSLGGFEDWSNIVGGILALIGFSEWRGNESSWHRIADPDGEDLRRFVADWWERFGGVETTAGELATLAHEKSIALACFTRSEVHSGTLKFTKRFLQPNVNRPVDKWIIRRRDKGNSAVYALEAVPCSLVVG